MDKEMTISRSASIEKKHQTKADAYKENSHNFRKLIAEIVVEIIIKKKKNGCNRIYQDK